MGDTSMLQRLSMTSALRASWRAVISILEQCDKYYYRLILLFMVINEFTKINSYLNYSWSVL